MSICLFCNDGWIIYDIFFLIIIPLMVFGLIIYNTCNIFKTKKELRKEIKNLKNQLNSETSGGTKK